MPSSVRDELFALHEITGALGWENLRDGSWILDVVGLALDDYAPGTTAEALRALHPGLPDDDLADARIDDARRRAVRAAGLTAGTYASVVVTTLAVGGATTAAALPVALGAFALDVAWATLLQLRLGWDLATVYHHPIDPSDPADLEALARIALGVPGPAEELGSLDVARQRAPELSRFGTRAATTAARLGLRAVGRTAVQRSLTRFAVPVLGVPLCAAVNYVTVGTVGKAAKSAFRRHAHAREAAARLEEVGAPLLLDVVALVLRADGKLHEVETTLAASLADRLDATGLARSAFARLQERLRKDDEAALLDRVAGAEPHLKPVLYEAAVQAAALDAALHQEEYRLLRRLAAACDQPWEPRRVAEAIARAKG